MTRNFQLTLTDASKWYSLWDLIIAGIEDFDPTFSNTPFIPDRVCELKWQNLSPGSFLRLRDKPNDPYAAEGFITEGYAWDVSRARGNVIDLKNQFFSTDTAGALMYVALTAN